MTRHLLRLLLDIHALPVAARRLILIGDGASESYHSQHKCLTLMRFSTGSSLV